MDLRQPTLAAQLRRLADENHPRADELRSMADRLCDAAQRFKTEHRVDEAHEETLGRNLVDTWREARALRFQVAYEPNEFLFCLMRRMAFDSPRANHLKNLADRMEEEWLVLTTAPKDMPEAEHSRLFRDFQITTGEALILVMQCDGEAP